MSNEQEVIRVDNTIANALTQQSEQYDFQRPTNITTADVFPAETFTVTLFKTHPEYFGISGMSLIYALQGASQKAPESYYVLFDTFLRHRSQQIISDALRGKPYAFTNDVDLLFTWARLIESTGSLPIFEPIHSQLNAVLKSWIPYSKVTYNGKEYDLKDFEPICYTWSGENILHLLPYICYLFTFYIECRPYAFCEVLSADAGFHAFRNKFNAYLQSNYERVINENGKQYSVDGIGAFLTLPERTIKTFLDTIISPVAVSTLISDVINAQPGLLEEALRDQNAVNDEVYVHDAYVKVMSNLLNFVVDASPVKTIIQTFPTFDSRYINTRELMFLTQYCFTGGDKPFCVDEVMSDDVVTYAYSAYSPDEPPKGYPKEFLSPQRLKSKVNKLAVGYWVPFASCDLISNMFTGYLHEEFQTERENNMIGSDAFVLDESVMRKVDPFNMNISSFSTILRNLFVNGVWMYDNSSMSTLLTELSKVEVFRESMNNILQLCNVTQICYNNRLGSLLIESFIMSWLNKWLLAMIKNKLDLTNFDPWRFLVQVDMTQYAISARISKLRDMLTALFYLSSDRYCTFVNYKIREFTNFISSTSIIQIPYVRCIGKDNVELYSVGGIETYRAAFISNPLERGYHIVTNAYGNCEQMYTVYRWIRCLTNSALFELIEQNRTLSNELKYSIRQGLEQLYFSGNIPDLLCNYEFVGLQYRLKQYVYAMDIRDDRDDIVSVFRRYSLPRANSTNAIGRKVYFQYIPMDGGKFAKSFPAPVENGILYEGRAHDAVLQEEGVAIPMPIYDVNPIVEDVCVSYDVPPGMNQIICELIDSHNNGSTMSVLLWTRTYVGDKFTRYLGWSQQGNMSLDDRLVPKTEVLTNTV